MIDIKNFSIATEEKYLPRERLEQGLNVVDDSGKNHLVHYAYILHDKDKNEDGSLKEAHWHILGKMDNSYSFEYIAKRFGVPTHLVKKIEYRFANALNYLTHNTLQAKLENKYHYEDEEVYSNYLWKNERQKAIDSDNKKNRKDEIRELIINGTIRKYNYYDYISATEYDTYKKTIENAFQYREDKLKGSDRNLEVIYINGLSGSGKTTYAKEYAKKLGYSAYVSSGSNDVLDDYKEQDCLILDDLRPNCMGLSDLLKMLDNHTNSSVKSRFKNKSLNECKLIIITSILDIDTFYKNVFDNKDEPIKQLQRRCKTKIRMTNDEMYVSLYDEEFGDYGDEIKYKNPIANKYQKKTFSSIEEYKQEAEKFVL